MDSQPSRRAWLRRGLLLLVSLGAGGCSSLTCRQGGCGVFGRGGWRSRLRGSANYNGPPPAGLGTYSDPFWQKQVDNADAADFVIYNHEFQLNGIRLNFAGEDHLKQIAARLIDGASYPVVIERSLTSANVNTKHKIPVYPNPELDNQRRELVVKALTAMGVPDVENRVVVAMPYSESRPVSGSPTGSGQQGGGGAFGGGFGGFGGFGGGMGGGGGGIF